MDNVLPVCQCTEFYMGNVHHCTCGSGLILYGWCSALHSWQCTEFYTDNVKYCTCGSAFKESCQFKYHQIFFFFNKSLFWFQNRKMSSDASSKDASSAVSGSTGHLLFLHSVVSEMWTSPPEKNRKKAVQEFKGWEGPRCALETQPKSPLPACPRAGSLPLQSQQIWPCQSSLSGSGKAMDAPFCLYRKSFGIQAGQRQNSTLSGPVTQVSLPSWNELFLPGSSIHSLDFWSSHFSYNLQKNQVINVFLKMWFSSNTSQSPEWKGPNLCSHIRVHQLFFDLNIG